MKERIYSIYIRTLGKGGDKYTALLKSIDSQTIPPKEVVVVLPKGYNPPKEKLGYERFVYSDKGMVKQRLFAIDDVRTPYILLLDDDVEFEPQYVEKMFDTLAKANAQCCIPILEDCARDKSFVKKYLNRFIGNEIAKPLNGDFFMKINRCGGFVLNTKLDINRQYYSQTGHGSNCFAASDVLKEIHFADELWLEKSGYPLPEDQVMFYKIYLCGYKIAVSQDAYFKHLDAASTNDGKRYIKIAQAKAGNYLVFWYRFIYGKESGFGKVISLLFIVHRIFWESFFYILKCHNMGVAKGCLKGLSFGLKFIGNIR